MWSTSGYCIGLCRSKLSSECISFHLSNTALEENFAIVFFCLFTILHSNAFIFNLSLTQGHHPQRFLKDFGVTHIWSHQFTAWGFFSAHCWLHDKAQIFLTWPTRHWPGTRQPPWPLLPVLYFKHTGLFPILQKHHAPTALHKFTCIKFTQILVFQGLN